MFEKVQAERRIGSGRVIADVLTKGSLRPELTVEDAADILWVLNDAGLYHLLVQRRGWTQDKFQSWLSASMRSELLAGAD